MAKVARLIVVIFAVFLCEAGLIKPANADGLTLISDAQTQNFLADILKPLFNAAQISFDANKIFVVRDNSLNAFVSDGNYMFVHSGTLIEAKNTNELAGILAHETGHILGGHIVRQKLKIQKMQYIMLGSMLAAGAAAISTGRGDAAMAVVLGSQSSAINSLLHYQMQEERNADESAIKLLAQTKQSSVGLLNFMKKVKLKNTLSGLDESSYFRTHPLTNERINHFITASQNNHYPQTSKLDGEFLLIKAKLAAFLLDKEKVLRMYPQIQNTAPARYAHCILALRQGNINSALKLIDGLIKEQPQNPYFYELRGQILFEGGQVARSVTDYQKALNLLPNNHILQTSLAHAMLESPNAKQNVQKIITLLQKSLVTDSNPFGWQLLSRAYDINNQPAESYYAAAEYSYAIDNLETAKRQLHNARKAGAGKSLKLKITDLEQRIKDETDE